MKLLTFAVPCYNSEAYMENCIRSLLPGGEDVEIIIVDDGSKDGTAAIADRYAAEYPTIIKAVHQENGGHGEAVNAGLRNATGLYFKVVDSDDWVNPEAYQKVLRTLKELVHAKEVVDMMICNYVYEKQGALKKKVMRYKTAFPREQVFGWNDVKIPAQGSVYPHAFCHLPHENAVGLWTGAAEAYFLSGQHFCVPAAAPCEKDVLSGRELLPVFYRKRGSVCQ